MAGVVRDFSAAPPLALALDRGSPRRGAMRVHAHTHTHVILSLTVLWEARVLRDWAAIPSQSLLFFLTRVVEAGDDAGGHRPPARARRGRGGRDFWGAHSSLVLRSGHRPSRCCCRWDAGAPGREAELHDGDEEGRRQKKNVLKACAVVYCIQGRLTRTLSISCAREVADRPARVVEGRKECNRTVQPGRVSFSGVRKTGSRSEKHT